MGFLKFVFYVLLIYLGFKLLKYLLFLWLYFKSRKFRKKHYPQTKSGDTNIHYMPKEDNQNISDKENHEYIPFENIDKSKDKN